MKMREPRRGRRRPSRAAPSPSRCSLPVRRRWASTRASAHSMRSASCSFDISSENRPTVSPVRSATCWAMLRQKEVLPIAGRAATMIRSPFCRPAGHLVDVDEAGGEPRDQLLRLRELVDGAEALLDDLAHRRRSPGGCASRRCRRSTSRPVEERRRLVLALEAGLDDAVAGVDQVPEDRLLLDDPAPVLDVRDARARRRAGLPGRPRRPPPRGPTRAPARPSASRGRSAGCARRAPPSRRRCGGAPSR